MKKVKCPILKIDTNIVNLQGCLSFVESLTRSNLGSYICVSNVHMCMEVFDDIDFATVVNNADLVIPDGRPIYWIQKLLGYKNAEHVRGQVLMHELCRLSGSKNINIGLYGGSSSELLELVVLNLTQSFPDINITFKCSPPFRKLTEVEDADVVSKINSANVDILFVGIGCPKQEVWMSEHINKLSCVMLGVGAAFDFIAGSKKYAPVWMQNAGLEWLFRLYCEPIRLSKRYLKQNPRFVYYFLKDFLKNKLS